MFRLIYLLIRQQVRQRASDGAAIASSRNRPRRRARIGMLSAVALCAAGAVGVVSYFRLGPASPVKPGSASATLHVRVDAIESAPLVVFLESPSASFGSVDAPNVAIARIASVNNAFEPMFQVASMGTPMEVRNHDPVPHNTHVFSSRRRTLFNVAIPAADVPVRRLLTQAGLFEVRCDIHPWMRAWLFVPPDAPHAVFWVPGEVRVPGIVPGSYRFHEWQPARGESIRTLTLAPGEAKVLTYSQR